MKKISRSAFIAIVIGLLFFVQIQPVLADDVYKTQYVYKTIPVYWGNGVDDNGDGVVDDLNESDVTIGNGDYLNESDHVVYEWTDTIDLDKGVAIGAYVETPVEVQSSANTSINPDQTCYYLAATTYSIKTTLINALTFDVQLSPKDLMTGTSDFFYRSPILWDPALYSEYYLNIYDSDDELVFASMSDVAGTPPFLNPDFRYSSFPYLISDNSTNETGYERLYMRICMALRTEETYTFKEYIKTVGDLPINSIKIELAVGQDIGNDNITSSYIFLGSSAPRKIMCEPSWSMLCLVGLGRAGLEWVVAGGTFVAITSELKTGTTSINNVKSIQIVFPMRCTKLLNVSFSIMVYSGAGSAGYISPYITVGGTWGYWFNISDPDITQPNTYSVTVSFNNLTSDTDGVLFTTYDTTNSTVWLFNNHQDTVMRDQRIQNSALFLEVHEYDAPLPSRPLTMNTNNLLIMGWANLIAGLIFSFIAISAGLVPFGFLVAGMAVSSFINAAGMFTAFDAMTGGLGGIGNGLVTIFKPVIDGITWLAGGLYSIGLKLVEAVKFMGSFLMENGAVILEAFVEIIYFIIFLLAMLGWTLFLSTMRFILKGDFEGAWRFFRRGFLSNPLKATKAVYRETAGRGIKVFRRHQKRVRARQKAERADWRQERKTRAYEESQDIRQRGEGFRSYMYGVSQAERARYYNRRSRQIDNENARNSTAIVERKME